MVGLSDAWRPRFGAANQGYDMGAAGQFPQPTQDQMLQAALLAMPMGAVVSGISAAPRLAAGSAGLYGMTASSPVADSTESADLRELRKSLMDQGSPELARLYEALSAARNRQGSIDAEAGRARPGSQARSADQGRRALAAEVASLEAAIAAERSRVEQEVNDRAQSVMSGRSAGEEARSRERAKAPPTFNEYYSGLQRELPMLPPAWALPMAGGAAAVGLSRGMSLPSAWLGRAKASQALNSGQYAAAERLATAHAPGQAGHWLADAATGALGGFSLGTLPLAADAMMQPAYNPEKLAQEAYVGELLDIDPRKQAAQARAEQLSDSNPALDKTKDWTSWARGMGAGALEGAFGGKFAGLGVDALKPRFTNVSAEAARLRAAANGAPGNGAGPGGGGGGGNVPQHPLANTQGSYPSPGSDGREYLRQRYQREYSSALNPPVPSDFSRRYQGEATAVGGSLPNMRPRVTQTNAAVRDFEMRTGRPPVTDADWAQIFRMTGTLAVPLTAFGFGYASPDRE